MSAANRSGFTDSFVSPKYNFSFPDCVDAHWLIKNMFNWSLIPIYFRGSTGLTKMITWLWPAWPAHKTALQINIARWCPMLLLGWQWMLRLLFSIVRNFTSLFVFVFMFVVVAVFFEWVSQWQCGATKSKKSIFDPLLFICRNWNSQYCFLKGVSKRETHKKTKQKIMRPGGDLL